MSAQVGVEMTGDVMRALERLRTYRDECANPSPDYLLRRKYRTELFEQFDALRDRLKEDAVAKERDKKAICQECLARVRQFAGQPVSERLCTHCSSDLFLSETAGEDVADGQFEG